MKREKYKTNKALALFLCTTVLLFSIGLALARGAGQSEPYKTTDLILTQGDSDYDLTSGISYDQNKYTLSVTDEGEFDINKPGTYVADYMLTPVTSPAVIAPPSDIDGFPPEDQTQGQTSSGEKPEGPPSKPDLSTPGAESDDSGNPSAPKPEKPATPDDITPSKPASSPALQPDTKPTPSPASKPDTKPAPSPASKPDVKPTPSPASKPDTKPTPSPASKPDTKPTPSPASKPDTKPTPSPASKPDVNPTPTSASTPDKMQNPAPKPDVAQDSDKPASTGKTKPSINRAALQANAVSSNLLAAAHGQGSLFLSQNQITGDPAYGVAAVVSNPLTLADVSKSGDPKQQDTKTSVSKAERGSASASTENAVPYKGTGSSDGAKPSPGGHSDGANPSKAPASAPGTTDSQTGGQSFNPEVSDSQTGDPSAASTPGTTDSQTGGQSSASETDSSSQDPSATTSTTIPPATDQSVTPGAFQAQNQTGAQTAGRPGGQMEASTKQPEVITFTRNIVVNPAVEYQNIRLDASNGNPSQNEIDAALLSDMKYNKNKYSIKVTDDGHFFADRIGEYKVSYELAHAENGDKIADLERYVWITAPGIWFETQPLTVDASKSYDLFAGIKYDSTKYEICLVDGNAFDVSQQGPQRVMYRLTLRSGNEKAKTPDTAKTGDGTGANLLSPAGIAEPSVPDEGHTGQLTGAIFGREVTVDNGYFIHIDAPPLIVTLGGVQTVDLLEGVTATDEKGNPVKPVVVDRRELDQSIKAAETEDPSAVTNGESKPGQGGGEAASSSDANQNPPDQRDKAANTAASSGEKSAMPSDRKSAASSDGKKDAVSQPSPFSSTFLMRSLPDFGATSDTNQKNSDTATPSPANDMAGAAGSSGGSTTGGTASSSGQSAAGETTTPAIDTSAETTPPALAENGPVIDLSKNATLPANLPPGVYSVLLGARNSTTGELTTISRLMKVGLSNGPISVTGSNGIANSAGDFAAAFKMVGGLPKGTADHPITYTINSTVGAPYGMPLKQSDVRALTGMVNMGPYTTVVITSEGRPVKCIASSYPKVEPAPDRIVFPFSSDYTQSTKFVLKNISIAPVPSSNFFAVANGSQLTLDTGFKYPKGSGSNGVKMYAVGGQKFDTFTTTVPSMNTNLIIQGGENGTGNTSNFGSEVYDYACGGNWNAWTKGISHLTLDGPSTGPKATTYVYASAGSGGVKRAGVSFDQMGSSYLTVKGGKIMQYVYAGCAGSMNGDSHATVSGGDHVTIYGGSADTQIGSCALTITGGKVKTANGGSIYTGRSQTERCDTLVEISGTASVGVLNSSGTSTQFGDATVNMEGGTVGTLSFGGTQAGRSTATANINGGKVDNLSGSYSNVGVDKNTTYIINVNSNQKMNQISYFDKLNIADNVTLAVGTKIMSYADGGMVYSGEITFGTNSVLSLPKAANKAGKLITAGQGARLEIVRQTDQNAAPLSLYSGSIGVSADKQLELKFVGPGADQATSGDSIFRFVNSKTLAGNTSGYTGLFPPNDYIIYGNPSNGFVRLGYAVSLQEGSDINAPLTYYGTVAAAMKAIGSGPDYRLTVRQQNYALTAADGLALSQYGGSARHITFTSGFVITASDSLQSGEPVGTAVRRTVVIGSDPSLQMAGVKPDISFTTNTTVENMRLNYLLADGSIYANGHHLLVGEKVEVNSDNKYFPALFGGSKSNSVASANLEVNSGKYSEIYGGGREATATVNGDATIKIGGIGELVGGLYGGGLDGNVTGDTIINISGGKLTGGDVQHLDVIKNRVVGGGRNGNVGGSCSITINGGTATGPVEVAGCDSGTVEKNVSIDITKGDAEQSITLPMAHVYGGGLTGGGQVLGDVIIKLNKGADYGTVSGGGKPAVDESGNVTAQDGSVHGSKSITVLGSVEAYNVVNFSALNLGVAGGGKTTLMIKKNMDSNWGAAADKSDRTGDLKFYGGSVLDLTGADQSLAVRNIFTNRKDNPSHLHIHKDANGTYPLYVAGQNISDPENKLVLGSVGSGQNSESGDELLVFHDKANAKREQYRPDATNLDIVVYETIVRYGLLDYPKAKLDRVLSTEPDTPDNVKTGVNKTLSFTFSSVVDGVAAAPVIAAYMDGYPASNRNWLSSSGNPSYIPADATNIDIIPNPSPDGEIATWKGTITRNIKQPDPSSKMPFYFVHVLANDGAYRTFAVDVHCPDNLGTTEVSQAGSGDYTLNVTFQDSKKDISEALAGAPTTDETKKVTYTASGLYQTAWCVGDLNSGPPPEAVEAALKWPMDSSVSSLHDVTIVNQDNPFAEENISFHVPQQYLGAKPSDVKQKIVYLFVKDWNGNTRQVAVPMSETLIDVTIPLRAGVIAMTGETTSEVAAPVCYVTNNSRMKVAAEIIDASQDSVAADGLTFVGETDESILGQHEINLEITEAPGTKSTSYSFQTRPVVNISKADPLRLGIMAPAQGSSPSALTPTGSSTAQNGVQKTSGLAPDSDFGTAQSGSPKPGSSAKAAMNPYVYFTFDALFNPEVIIHTKSWNICRLTYRFTMIPAETPPASVPPATNTSSPGAPPAS